MPKPGVMLYFDLRPCLKRLGMEQKGQLFEAILEYGEFGAVPNFDDDIGLAVAWDLIRPMIDRDNERYEKISKRRSEAACKRWGTNNANASNSIQEDANDTNASSCMQTDANFGGCEQKRNDGHGENLHRTMHLHNTVCKPMQTMPTTTTPTTTATTTPTPTTTTATTPLSYGEPKNPAVEAVQAGFDDLKRAKLQMLSDLQ